MVQVQGRNYVDVDGLARLTNGNVSFQGNQIVLTLTAAKQSVDNGPANEGLPAFGRPTVVCP